jgi:hypothetical protein
MQRRNFQNRTASHSVDTRTMTIAVPNISSRASLNISGFINSSRRISTPGSSFFDTYRP